MDALARLNATRPVLAWRTKVAIEFVSVSSPAANPVGSICESWRRKVLGVKTISNNTVQEVYSLARAWKRSSGIHPEWGKIALTIKRLNRSSVLRARHVLLEFIRD